QDAAGRAGTAGARTAPQAPGDDATTRGRGRRSRRAPPAAPPASRTSPGTSPLRTSTSQRAPHPSNATTPSPPPDATRDRPPHRSPSPLAHAQRAAGVRRRERIHRPAERVLTTAPDLLDHHRRRTVRPVDGPLQRRPTTPVLRR